MPKWNLKARKKHLINFKIFGRKVQPHIKNLWLRGRQVEINLNFKIWMTGEEILQTRDYQVIYLRERKTSNLVELKQGILIYHFNNNKL